MVVGILTTGHANIRSLSNTAEKLGYSVRQISHPHEIREVDKLILPGVGAFPAVMGELVKKKIVPEIRSFAEAKPLLGICLGMQLMFESSDEHGVTDGLALVKGKVRALPKDLGLVPHVGWNELTFDGDCSLVKGLKSNSNVYFVHSYHCIPEEPAKVVHTNFYGTPVVAGFQRENVFGVQFHPEKSQNVGYSILRNFLEFGNA